MKSPLKLLLAWLAFAWNLSLNAETPLREQLIDMTGHAQIDFKAVDFGTCQIDDVKLWQGL